MKRIHFFELEDFPWFPQTLRNGITDFLEFLTARTHLFRSIAPLLANALTRSGAQRVVDLCSGSGGPWRSLKSRGQPGILASMPVVLTDFFPNPQAWDEATRAAGDSLGTHPLPVDARRVPDTLTGFRTLFSAFHHFAPTAARQIIGDAVAQRQGIAIFESTQRHPLMLAYMLLTPLLVMLTVPFQRGLSLTKLFWTYVIPLLPLCVMFDGIVSCLRTYTPAELRGLVEAVPGADDYDWQYGVARLGPLPVGITYMLGYPRPAARDRTP